MNLDDYPDQDGKEVWPSQDEVDQPLDATDDVAFRLAVRCGLRSEEVIGVTPNDVVDTDAGMILRIWNGAKTGEYRETPIPEALANTITTIADVRDEPDDEPIVDVSKRTLRRRIAAAAEQLEAEIGDAGWQYVGMHDLRRTWATQLRSADVDAMVVLDWGGWNDLDAFLDHYRGTHTPEAQRRERGKVDWL